MSSFIKDPTLICDECKCRDACFVSRLGRKAQRFWDNAKLTRLFHDGDIIFTKGDEQEGVFVVCRGRVKIVSPDEKGHKLLNWIKTSGEPFGYITFFASGRHQSVGTAMGETRLSMLDQKKFAVLIQNCPETAGFFLRQMAVELRALKRNVSNMIYTTARVKVATALDSALSDKAVEVKNMEIFGLKRVEIANMTGLAVETVVRALNAMEKENIIKRNAKSIKITDYEALLKIFNEESRRKRKK